MKQERIIKKTELIIIFLISLLIVFGVTAWMGTLTSGWHFVDDHEFIGFDYYTKYEHWSLGKVIMTNLQRDMKVRNRFLYYPCRILLFAVLGANPFLLHVEKAIETAISMTIMYWCGKKISGSKFAAAMFSLTSLVGYQAAVWWKLGPPQIQALICFGISFLCLLYLLDNTKKISLSLVSVLFAIAMGGFHESFMLLIPFMIFYVILDAYNKGLLAECFKKGQKGKLAAAIKGLGKDRIIYIVLLALAFVIYFLTVVIRLGLNSYSAVGVDSETSVITYAKVIISNFNHDLKWYWIFGVMLVGVLLTFYENLKAYWGELVLFLLIVVPQLVLYGKEGIAERYVIPFSVGFALFFGVHMLDASFLQGNRKKLYVLLLLVLLAVHTRVTIIEADYYRFRGQSVTTAMTMIEELTDKGYTVMTCFGNANPEAEFTINAAHRSKKDKDIYYWDQDECLVVNRPAFYDEMEGKFIDLDEVDVILAYNRNDRHFEVDPNIDLSDFVMIRSGSVDYYFRNEATNELTDEFVERLRVKPTIFGIGE